MLIFLSCKNYVVRQKLTPVYVYDVLYIITPIFGKFGLSKCDVPIDISTICLKLLSVTGNIQSMYTLQVHGALWVVLAFLSFFSQNITFMAFTRTGSPPISRLTFQSASLFWYSHFQTLILTFSDFDTHIFRLSIQTLRCWQYRESDELGQLVEILWLFWDLNKLKTVLCVRCWYFCT